MPDTSARLLTLLSILQSEHTCTGAYLSERLGVARRTVRRDIERLRDLGYPVEAEQGTAGYRLGPGAALPPLLLDDDEAVAVVLGLRRGSGEASARALAKLEQVLPSRLRYRVETLVSATVHAGEPVEPTVATDVLLAVAESCRRSERLRFDYHTPHSGSSRRNVEPHRMVSFNGRWYLVAFDLDRDDWRTFRVDRMAPRIPGGARFRPREIPHGDAVTYVEHHTLVHDVAVSRGHPDP